MKALMMFIGLCTLLFHANITCAADTSLFGAYSLGMSREAVSETGASPCDDALCKEEVLLGDLPWNGAFVFDGDSLVSITLFGDSSGKRLSDTFYSLENNGYVLCYAEAGELLFSAVELSRKKADKESIDTQFNDFISAFARSSEVQATFVFARQAGFDKLVQGGDDALERAEKGTILVTLSITDNVIGLVFASIETLAQFSE